MGWVMLSDEGGLKMQIDAKRHQWATKG